MIYIVAALLITLLGVVYVKGFDLVKRHSPDRLPQFCLLMAAIRFLLLATLFAAKMRGRCRVAYADYALLG